MLDIRVQRVIQGPCRSCTVHLGYCGRSNTFLVFASSVIQSNHFTARYITAVTIFQPKNPISAKRMHPIPNACRFRRSVPAFFTPGSSASSICVLFKKFGIYLKSNVVSFPRPPLFLMMTCQNTLRRA